MPVFSNWKSIVTFKVKMVYRFLFLFEKYATCHILTSLNSYDFYASSAHWS